MVKNKMATIFMPNLRSALTSYTADSSQGIFGGVEQVTKTLDDTKKTNTLIKQSLHTKKTGKAGAKSRKNKGKKPMFSIKAPITKDTFAPGQCIIFNKY